MKSGFTLVEILVVIAVLSIVGLLVLYIFTNSLRGSNKAQILSSIKKNGQAVLETMDKTVRNSDNVVCVSQPSTSLVIVKNGIYTRYRFIPLKSSANGEIRQDNPVKQINPSTNKEETDTVFVNRVCLEADPIMSGYKILTDTNLQTGVSIQNGTFTPGKQAGFRDTVTISFEVAPGVGAPAAIAGQIDPVKFTTTVGLR